MNPRTLRGLRPLRCMLVPQEEEKVGYSITNVDGVPVAGEKGLTLIAVGARRGSYEPREPF